MPKVVKATSNSKKLRILSTLSTPYGRLDSNKVLGPKSIQLAAAQCNAQRRVTEQIVLSDIDIPDEYDSAPFSELNMEDVLEGRTEFTISHAGGELQNILAECLEDEARQRTKDPRTRRDRTEKRNAAFSKQMPGMVRAYLSWTYRAGDDALEKKPESMDADGKKEGSMQVQVLDVFQTYSMTLPILDTDQNIPAAYLAQQFTIAFDVYLDIRYHVSQRIHAALGRNVPQWHLKNACPACTYKLEHEGDLIFKMLFTMDGNNSLKRLRGATVIPPSEEGGMPESGESKVREDSRTVHGDRYLTREMVDRWAKEQLEGIISPLEDDADDNPCAGRWTNMINEVTAKMWGIFDETGIFLALCRHGFSLVITDMVQSGELSKYPLAIVNVLLDAFGEDLGGGYDIGCRFATTVQKSDLREKAQRLRFTSLVGAFHGHAHNRICQLSNLATYVKGMGLEDLEGCESLLTSPGAFLVNNYRQALGLLAGETTLKKTMEDQGIPSTDVFHQWLEEERAYLAALAQEPIEETLEIEYYQKLVNYQAALDKLNGLQNTWHAFDPSGVCTARSKHSKNPEMQVRHAMELVDRALASVQDLEMQLEATGRWKTRWRPEDAEWKEAAVLAGRRRYQRCLDKLESLIVSRMFELTKMNLSQTGYKLQKHIAKALKARSQAIKSTLERYNTAVSQLIPPRRQLEWNEVVEYAFLADFDLLRDCCQNISERPWARPSARLAMDQYFRIERAREEIQRLNIEIKQVVTHMRDEEAFLLRCEQQLKETDPILAFHVRRYCKERTRFYEAHRRRFNKLALHSLFSGTLEPGSPVDTSLLSTSIPNYEYPADSGEDIIRNDIIGVDEEDNVEAEAEADEGKEDEGTIEKEITEAMEAIFLHG
ncbi:hypothetical protein H0H92_004952 [Tricholoma furcatifolium]|nr:hypothetical protein H0H92_004952 [Tricholoma furcatifolium]